METTGKSEHIIQEVVGCGLSQVILSCSSILLTLPSMAFSLIFMAFGNYNPGWRCLDSDNITVLNIANGTQELGIIERTTVATLNMSSGTQEDTQWHMRADCPAYDSCKSVEFDPDTSTIISEWNLLCGKAWISSTIISLQMAGLAVGCPFAGFIGDSFGRKKAIYSAQVFTAIFNATAAFSTSWQMFAVVRFFLGISTAIFSVLGLIHVTEFVTKKWRSIFVFLPSFPVFVVCFAIVSWVLKDWRHVHIATAVISGIGFIPVLWMPESLRWLEVRNKMNEFDVVAQRLAKWNGKKLLPSEEMPEVIKLRITNSEMPQEKSNVNIFRETLKLFRRDYRLYTIIAFVHWMSASIIYYALGFGVKSLGGSLYLNLIIFFGVEVVVDASTANVPNLIGRKKTGFICSAICGICLLITACLDRTSSGDTKTLGITALVATGRIAISGFWAVLAIYLIEIYPTVSRGAVMSYCLTSSRLGGILAPVLIPNDPSTFFICYTVMGCLAIVCAGTTLILPETKGTVLKETFETNGTTIVEPTPV